MPRCSDFITKLTSANRILTKTWEANGGITNSKGAKYFRCEELTVDSIHDLSQCLQELEGDSHSAIIRGRYLGEKHSREVEPSGTKTGPVLRRKSVFEDTPHHWILIDIDDYEPFDFEPLVDPVGAIREFVRLSLPPCFHDTSFHWQLSSSAGHPSKNPRVLKAHVWFWLTNSYTSGQLSAFAKESELRADKSLFDTIQLHYTAAPVIAEGVKAPHLQRSGFFVGTLDEVSLDIPQEIPIGISSPTTRLSRHQKLHVSQTDDPVMSKLAEKGMIKSHRSDGGLNIVCPREHHHTSESGESSTLYYPAHTGRFIRGTFVCLHSHCVDASQQEFIKELGFDDLADGFGDLDSWNTVENFGDIANGRRFSRKHKGEYLFVHATSAWYRWDGQRWSPCDNGEAMSAAKGIADECLDEAYKAYKISPTDTAKRAKGQAEEVHRKLPRLQAMLQAASTEPEMSIAHPGLFDAHPLLMNVRNGVLDLRRAQLIEPDPAMLLSRQTGCEFDRFAECPLWLGFLDTAMGGDSEMIGFLQRICGYALTGLVDEEKLFFFYGTGANGKSVFANVLLAVFGEYGVTVRAALLARDSKGNSSDAEREKARLPGSRIALMNETGQSDIWDDQRTKEMVSRENISARQLYSESFEFTPTHKLFIRGNHQPGVMDNSDGFWRRIVLIGFTRQIPESERILDLDRRIIERELPGVLAWMVDGCLAWQKNGLQVPDKVAAAVNSYRKDTDLLGEWILTECVTSPNTEGVSTELFRNYVDFLRDANIKPPSRNMFGRQLVQRGFRKRESCGRTLYVGISVRNPFADEL